MTSKNGASGGSRTRIPKDIRGALLPLKYAGENNDWRYAHNAASLCNWPVRVPASGSRIILKVNRTLHHGPC